jgi:hypothetical protein
MAWRVTMTTANGPIDSPEDGRLPDDYSPLSATAALAKFAQRIAEDHGRFGEIGFRPPLTVTIEEVE